MVHTFWLDICKLKRIRIRFRIQLINFDVDPDPDFYLMRIQVTKIMLILADPDPDPQHCTKLRLRSPLVRESNSCSGGRHASSNPLSGKNNVERSWVRSFYTISICKKILLMNLSVCYNIQCY
jgi:hypothetical protein